MCNCKFVENVIIVYFKKKHRYGIFKIQHVATVKYAISFGNFQFVNVFYRTARRKTLVSLRSLWGDGEGGGVLKPFQDDFYIKWGG
jgi:hypothetical protein